MSQDLLILTLSKRIFFFKEVSHNSLFHIYKVIVIYIFRLFSNMGYYKVLAVFFWVIW